MARRCWSMILVAGVALASTSLQAIEPDCSNTAGQERSSHQAPSSETPRSEKQLASEVSGADALQGALRDWTVQDSVQIRYVVADHDTYSVDWGIDQGNPIRVSPDGKLFFFTTYHGDLDCDCNVYTLEVYAASSILQTLRRSSGSSLRAVEPLRTVSFRSNVNSAAIVRAHWEQSSAAIMFLAVDLDKPRQVYRLSVASGELQQLTNSQSDVISYQSVGQSVIFRVWNDIPVAPALAAYPFEVITSSKLQEAVMHRPTALTSILASRNGAHPQSLITGGERSGSIMQISPDGTKAVVDVVGIKDPESWHGYDGKGEDAWPIRNDTEQESLPRMYLVDLTRGSSEPLFNAPTGIGTSVGRSLRYSLPPDVLWSKDGTHAILINSAIPLDTPKVAAGHMAYLVDYDVAAREWKVIEPLESQIAPELPLQQGGQQRVSRVSWSKSGAELIVEHQFANGRPGPAAGYLLQNGRWVSEKKPVTVWKPKCAEPNLVAGVSVAISESGNRPPQARARWKGREVALIPPDPTLGGVWRAAVEAVMWDEGGGRSATGGLMLPRRQQDAGAVPLVIQPYYYLPRLFRPDGFSPSGYAAQALVSQGMGVLQLDIPLVDRPELKGVAENVAFVNRIDAAVEALSQRGLIDARRVGLVGFSRAGYMTYYAVTHPGRVKLAAAIDIDGWTGGYSQYLLAKAFGIDGAIPDFERQMGQGTFWQNKEAWLEHETSFSVDRVRTPILFTLSGGPAVSIWASDTFGAFQLNHQPAEFAIFQGQHQFVRPKEREAAMQLSVDWMAFWLQGKMLGHEDRKTQYARWIAMKTLVNNTPSSP